MIFQSPAPTPWPTPKGPPPSELFEQYFHDLVYKTWGNISPLYQLDAFDYAILIVYFSILATLAVYGSYRIKQVIDFWRYRKFVPQPSARFAEHELPVITVQLPLFNELYVVDRLLKAVTAIDYPPEKLEIQVLDDSTDETVRVAEAVVAKYAAQGFDIHYIHRADRTGFKAGALENGNKFAKGELLAIFDADFVPKQEFLIETVPFFVNPTVAFVQTPQTYGNLINMVSRGAGYMQAVFYKFVQPGRNHFNAAFCVGPAHQQSADAAQEWACNPLPRQFLLGNKGEAARDHSRKHQRIQIARMIYGQHHVARRDRLFRLDLGRQPR